MDYIIYIMNPAQEHIHRRGLEKSYGSRSDRKRSRFCWYLMTTTLGMFVLLVLRHPGTRMMGMSQYRSWAVSLLETQRKQPVVVRIYLESLCIDSQRYVQQQILPTWEAIQAVRPPIMDLQIVVFGNAHYEDQTTHSLVCQHGAAECDANRYDLCVQSIEQNTVARYLPYMACLFDGRLPMGYRNTTFDAAIFEACARATAIPWSAVQDCYGNAGRIEGLEYAAYVETARTNHTYVPWVTLNGQHLENEDETNLLWEIWKVYNDDDDDNKSYFAPKSSLRMLGR
jgi:Gamma interferon inducible lysosomal thiol reductase (GILT)